MVNDARLLYATNQFSLDVAYGHAMPCAPCCVIDVDRIRILAHPISKIRGISVPISRGSPPVLTE